MSTIDALGEYWTEDIYTKSTKPKYIAIRNAAKGKEADDLDSGNDDDDDDKKFVNKWKIESEQTSKGPDRCLKGHSLQKCVKTPLMVLDLEDNSRYDQKNGGVCMYKYCKKNDNLDSAAGTNPIIDYLEETFYACGYDCCYFSVHEECFGGLEQNRDLGEE